MPCVQCSSPSGALGPLYSCLCSILHIQSNIATCCWLAVTARSTRLPDLCIDCPHGIQFVHRQYNLAATRLEKLPIFVIIQRSDDGFPILNLAMMGKEGLCGKNWRKYFPAATESERPSRGGEPLIWTKLLSEWAKALVVHSCGLLLTTGWHYRIAVWQFPSFPD